MDSGEINLLTEIQGLTLMKHLINWRLAIFIISFAMVGCMGDVDSSKDDFDKGKYRRIYGRSDDTYEIVLLKDEGVYVQTFYRHGKIGFSNSGKWTYKRNNNDSAKWPNGREIILFGNWLSADEIFRLENGGHSHTLSDINLGTVAAIVRSKGRFAFDEDGGSDYKPE